MPTGTEERVAARGTAARPGRARTAQHAADRKKRLCYGWRVNETARPRRTVKYVRDVLYDTALLPECDSCSSKNKITARQAIPIIACDP